jgi:hypothetical protein
MVGPDICHGTGALVGVRAAVHSAPVSVGGVRGRPDRTLARCGPAGDFKVRWILARPFDRMVAEDERHR